VSSRSATSSAFTAGLRCGGAYFGTAGAFSLTINLP
jgi:hypothetical protein